MLEREGRLWVCIKLSLWPHVYPKSCLPLPISTEPAMQAINFSGMFLTGLYIFT